MTLRSIDSTTHLVMLTRRRYTSMLRMIMQSAPGNKRSVCGGTPGRWPTEHIENLAVQVLASLIVGDAIVAAQRRDVGRVQQCVSKSTIG